MSIPARRAWRLCYEEVQYRSGLEGKGGSVVKDCHSVVEKGIQRIKDKAVKWLITRGFSPVCIAKRFEHARTRTWNLLLRRQAP